MSQPAPTGDLVLHERLTRTRLAGVAMALTGAALISAGSLGG